MSKALWEHYDRLQNIWLYEVGHSSACTISWNDFTFWCKNNKILDGGAISLADFDRTFILTNVNTHGKTSSAERNLNRYEFLEILVRFAKMKYFDGGPAQICRSLDVSIHKILADCVFPHSKGVDGVGFRMHNLYNVKVNEILSRNIVVIDKIYKDKNANAIISYHAKKKHILLDEAKAYVREVGLNVSEMMTSVIYFESLVIV